MDHTVRGTEASEKPLSDRERDMLAWAFAGEPVPLALESSGEPGVYV